MSDERGFWLSDRILGFKVVQGLFRVLSLAWVSVERLDFGV